MSIRDMNHWPLDEYPHLLHTLVFQAAIKIVKTKLRARGYKVHEYSLKELRALADAYLDAEAHRELLMAETIMKIQREPRLLRLAEGESKRRARERPKPMDPRKALERYKALMR